MLFSVNVMSMQTNGIYVKEEKRSSFDGASCNQVSSAVSKYIF